MDFVTPVIAVYVIIYILSDGHGFAPISGGSAFLTPLAMTG